MTERIFYTQDQFKGDLFDIIRQMEQANFKPDYVAGVARGGYVPAVYLAQWFECPVLSVKCSLRDNNEINLSELYTMGSEDKVLLVDDIIDSGDSFSKIESEFALNTGMPIKDAMNLKTASLWVNTNQAYDPDFHAREISRLEDQRWIVFPWEDWWKTP